MTKAQQRIVARFRRLVKDAHAVGLVLAADVGAWGVRFIPREEEQEADDLRTVGACEEFGPGEDAARKNWHRGETVSVDSTCGTPANKCTTM